MRITCISRIGMNATKTCLLIRLFRNQHVRSLQARLKQMEDLLRSAGIDPGDDGLDVRPGDDSQDHSSDDEDNYNDAGSSQTESTPLSITSPQSSVSDTIRPPQAPVFIDGESGEPIYFGKMAFFDNACFTKF